MGEALPIAPSSVQLLVFRFGPGSTFEGGLISALERLELGESIDVLDGLFVRRDRETGDATVFDLAGERVSGSTLVRLIDFRLDPEARRRATESALGDDVHGVAGSELRGIVAALAPGDAVVALLVDHVWTRTLDDAVERLGGATVVNRFVDAATIADVAADVRRAAPRG